MNNFDPTEYTITIKRQLIDNELQFVGRVMELPYVCVYEPSHEESYNSLMGIIEDLKSSADEDGESFPLPFSPNDEYSGRVTLRMPKSLHRQADFLSITNNTSLNGYIVNALAKHIGNETGKLNAHAENITLSYLVPQVPKTLSDEYFTVVISNLEKRPIFTTQGAVAHTVGNLTSKQFMPAQQINVPLLSQVL